jgi:hypothetical protein
VLEFLQATGFAAITWQQVVMLGVAGLLLWLAIVKGFEPLLLVPIGFGALLANLPLNGLMMPPHGEEIGGLFYYLSHGVRLEIFPPLIFLGLGALTDFGPLLSNPKTLLLGGAAQLGVVGAFLGAWLLGFTPKEAASIGIIGGADGPTSIYLTMKLAPHLLGPIAVSAYSYMALVPLIQPPIMRLLTTKEERAIRMEGSFDVPRWLRIAFPIVVTVVGALIVPAATALIVRRLRALHRRRRAAGQADVAAAGQPREPVDRRRGRLGGPDGGPRGPQRRPGGRPGQLSADARDGTERGGSHRHGNRRRSVARAARLKRARVSHPARTAGPDSETERP